MRILRILLLGCLFAAALSVHAEPVGAAFTYQGELTQQNIPATGAYDFEFGLFDAQSDGTSVATAIQLEDVSVRNGVFTVELDFGSQVLNGTQLWLELAVREGVSVDAYITMNPRQKITASPYATFAQASNGDHCTAITSIPYVVNNEGVYCFTGNLETSMTSGNAIHIQADNVVIDLNGWMLDGLSAGLATSTYGIFGMLHKNITVRNGTVRGFRSGIDLRSADLDLLTGHLIENIRAEENTKSGIRVDGNGNIVRHSQALGTGGSTEVGQVVGIAIQGSGGRALDNDIISTAAVGNGGLAYGLFLWRAGGAVVEGNRIDGVTTDTETPYGIYIEESNNVLVRGNSITNTEKGIYFFFGSTGKYRDNLTSGVTAPFTNGTDAGGND